MKKICVFCGSSSGNNPAFAERAVQLGHALADEGISLIYGGSQSGLMGVIANTVLERGGEVIGVMPAMFDGHEVVHHGLSHLHIVDTMQERKQMMFELADGFIALPGGPGTLDELAEILCLVQNGVQEEPIGLLEVAGYFTPWLKMFDEMVTQGFLMPEHRELLLLGEESLALIEQMRRVR